MENTYFAIYKAEDRPESRSLAQAEETLSELLKRIEDRELRDAIDRAAGRVGYLREAEGFEAGRSFAG